MSAKIWGLDSITLMHITEIESRYVNGYFEYIPDRWGLGFRILVGFTYGGWLGLNVTLGPFRLDLECARGA